MYVHNRGSPHILNILFIRRISGREFLSPYNRTLYRNLFMFVAKQTSPDQMKQSDWSKLLHMKRLRGGFSTISVLGDASFFIKMSRMFSMWDRQLRSILD